MKKQIHIQFDRNVWFDGVLQKGGLTAGKKRRCRFDTKPGIKIVRVLTIEPIPFRRRAQETSWSVPTCKYPTRTAAASSFSGRPGASRRRLPNSQLFRYLALGLETGADLNRAQQELAARSAAARTAHKVGPKRD